jgi:glycolate oxidase FAD binding subunit
VPRDRDDSARLLAAVANAIRTEQPLSICGRGSKTFLRGATVGDMLAVGDHCGVVDYAPSELVLTARAGTPLADLRRVLAEHGQMMAFDPPTFAGDGSLGGAVATGLSGPGRPWYGALRDAVLGVTLINGRAQRLKFGGSVMKNVAGYDVSRLMAGAFGTLGVLLDVSIKVLPRPQFESTRAFALDRSAAHANVVAWGRSALPLSATCHADGTLHVRLSGTEKGVRGAVARIGGDELSHASEFWDSVRDQTHTFFRRSSVYRVSLPPAAAYPALDGDWLTEWAGAQRWFNPRHLDQTAAIDQMARKLGGWAAKFGGADIAQRLDAGVLRYHRRIKQAFDPMALFNRAGLFAENGPS